MSTWDMLELERLVFRKAILIAAIPGNRLTPSAIGTLQALPGIYISLWEILLGDDIVLIDIDCKATRSTLYHHPSTPNFFHF
jgi:hypothetical protein